MNRKEIERLLELCSESQNQLFEYYNNYKKREEEFFSVCNELEKIKQQVLELSKGGGKKKKTTVCTYHITDDISVVVKHYKPKPETTDEQKIQDALKMIMENGGVDGAHHKQWCLDQIVRILCGNEKEYSQWVAEYNGDLVDGEFEYNWDKGIPG